MGAGRSGLFRGTIGGKSLKVHEGRQGKHIEGHNNYIHGRSILTITMEEAQQLVNMFAGTGTPAGDNRERVNFGRIIGYYADPKKGEKRPTTWGIIHYSKKGTHIVPAQPQNQENEK